MALPWTPADDKIVRKYPPAEAAKLTGHPLSSVRSRRFQLGINNGRQVRFFIWTKAADRIVRTKSPQEARLALGLGKSTIVSRRKLLGLPRWMPPKKPKPPPKRQTVPWTAKENGIVRRYPPREAMNRLPGRTLSAVYWHRFWLLHKGRRAK